MKHSIILWDCCYRNFFHLTGSLAEQDYPKDEYEVIWVEQRSRAASDAYNHRLGLQSLADTVALHAGRCDVRAVYLEQPTTRPYHIGVCVNAGTTLARGQIVTRMDGDMLVRRDFLRSLDRAMDEQPGVINMDKRGAARPVGVPLDRWMEGVIDFELCRAESPRGFQPIAPTVRNKGPCIAAPCAWIDATGGYDEHDLWATGISRNGQDLTARMEILSGVPSRALPDQFGVHPYHPLELNRQGEVESALFAAQQRLIDWSREHAVPALAARRWALEETCASVRAELEEHLAASRREAEEIPAYV